MSLYWTGPDTEDPLAHDGRLDQALHRAFVAGLDNEAGVWNAHAACVAFRQSIARPLEYRVTGRPLMAYRHPAENPGGERTP